LPCHIAPSSRRYKFTFTENAPLSELVRSPLRATSFFFRRGRDRNPRPHKTSYHPKLDVATPPRQMELRNNSRDEERRNAPASSRSGGIDRLINPRGSTRLGSAAEKFNRVSASCVRAVPRSLVRSSVSELYPPTSDR